MAVGAQKSRLGRGLASLIGDRPEQAWGADEDQRSVPLAALKPGRFNPRRNFAEGQLEELAASIRERGLVQPLVVRPSLGDTYEIVAGERRWRAAQLANLHDVPVVIRALSDQEAIEIAIIENVQREDLNAIEEGEGYRLLMDGHGYTQEDLAKVIGKSRSHLANTLRLLKLPDGVQDLVRSGELSAGHARALIGRPDAAALAARIVKEGLTVRQVEALTQERASAKPQRQKSKDADTRAAESELHEALGLDVEIKKGKGEKGELRIRYSSLEQLEDVRFRLLRRPALGDSEKLLCAEQRCERDAGLGIKVGGTLAAIENRDHQRDRRAGLGDRLDRVHGRPARGCHIFENDNGLAGDVVAVDALLGAVILHRLAHEEAGQATAEIEAPHGDRRDQRHRAHLQPTNAVSLNILNFLKN